MRGSRTVAWLSLPAVVAAMIGFGLITSAGAIEEPTTLTFVEHQVNETGIDVNGNHELDPADGWVSSGKLFQDGVDAGRLVSSCQYIKVRRDGMGGVLQCVSTVRLADGQITFQGRLDLTPGPPPDLAFAVTGGTGEYSNVRGYVTGAPIENSMDLTITLTLLP